MTRDERIAAGWVECWGVFDYADGTWLGDARSGWGGRRDDYGKACVATKRAADFVIGAIAARPFWRRKKPKAPPPLKVGDEVVVRGKVHGLTVGEVLVIVETNSGRILRARVSDCERIKP